MNLDKLPLTRTALRELHDFLVGEIQTTFVGLDSYPLDLCISAIIKATLKYWQTLPKLAIRPYGNNRTFTDDYIDNEKEGR